MFFVIIVFRHHHLDLADGDLLEEVHLDQLPYQPEHQPPFHHVLFS